MLVVTEVLIGAVLVTMMSMAAYIMQAVAWLPTTPVLGVFPPYWLYTRFRAFPTCE